MIKLLSKNLIKNFNINYLFSYFTPVYFAIFIMFLIFIYNFISLNGIYDLFSYVECSNGSNNKEDSIPLSLVGKISVSFTEAVKAGGIGYGAAKMIQACPPQSRFVATLGLGGLISGTTILLKALDNLKKDQNNISQSITKNNNENNSISSIFELEYFNSLNSEQIILYCCLFFIILATYFFLGLIINIILKNYLNLEKYQWIQNNKIFKIIFSWYSSTNKIMFFIISFIILYSLIITIIALIFLINHYDQLHSIHNL